MRPRIGLHLRGIGWQTFESFPVLLHPQLDKLPVLQRILPLQQDFPNAVFSPRHGMGIMAPSVEVSRQISRIRTRQPFTHSPSVLRPVDAEIEISVRKFLQIPGIFHQLIPFFLEPVHPQINLSAVGGKPGINPRNCIGADQLSNVHPSLSFRSCVQYFCRAYSAFTSTPFTS